MTDQYHRRFYSGRYSEAPHTESPANENPGASNPSFEKLRAALGLEQKRSINKSEDTQLKEQDSTPTSDTTDDWRK